MNYLVEKYRLEPLTFAFDVMRASSTEKSVPAEHHPPLFHVRAGQSYPRQAITFHVPFTGEPELLRREPSTRILWRRRWKLTVMIRLMGVRYIFDERKPDEF